MTFQRINSHGKLLKASKKKVKKMGKSRKQQAAAKKQRARMLKASAVKRGEAPLRCATFTIRRCIRKNDFTKGWGNRKHHLYQSRLKKDMQSKRGRGSGRGGSQAPAGGWEKFRERQKLLKMPSNFTFKF